VKSAAALIERKDFTVGRGVAFGGSAWERARVASHPSADTAMIALLVGIGVMLGALVVQGTTVVLGVQAIGVLLTRRAVGTGVWRNGLATLMLITVLLAGHLTQMALWATAFMATGEFEAFAEAFYHSAVNYTTLGYGDIVMSPRWRLLGPQEAASGTLAFGWSTAVIVTVVIRLVRYRHQTRRRDRAPVTS
jgi:ion channel